MTKRFDCIVIGSGFGGSVMSLRLVEKGYNTLLLERGRSWGMNEFPRTPSEMQRQLLWDPRDNQRGLMEVRNYPDSDVMTVTASGLGGGSLIYANVLLKMPPENFQGWPQGLNRESLDPYYSKVLEMLDASAYPVKPDSSFPLAPKVRLFQQLQKHFSKINYPGFIEVEHPPLAINFRGKFAGEQQPNKFGAIQSKCTQCGQCDLGCNIHAKNTLDLNYLYLAQKGSHIKHPLKIETGKNVEVILPSEGGYLVSDRQKTFEYWCQKLFICAGSIGSTELLLKNKRNGNLAKLSERLGKNWSGNGDFLGLVLDTKEAVEPTKGPVITSYLRVKHSDFESKAVGDLYVQDAGYPAGLAWYLSGKVPQATSLKNQIQILFRFIRSGILRVLGISEKSGFEVNIGDDLARALDKAHFIEHSMMLLGMGKDIADGEIKLNSKGEAIVHWQEDASRPHFVQLEKAMQEVATALHGKYMKNPIDYLDKIISVHPLGGCSMGQDISSGVVNVRGEAFNYPGLYIVDGSILPSSTGPNPSLTIAALAEKIAEGISFN